MHVKLPSTFRLGFTFIGDPDSSKEQSVFEYRRKVDFRNFWQSESKKQISRRFFIERSSDLGFADQIQLYQIARLYNSGMEFNTLREIPLIGRGEMVANDRCGEAGLGVPKSAR